MIILKGEFLEREIPRSNFICIPVLIDVVKVPSKDIAPTVYENNFFSTSLLTDTLANFFIFGILLENSVTLLFQFAFIVLLRMV